MTEGAPRRRPARHRQLGAIPHGGNRCRPLLGSRNRPPRSQCRRCHRQGAVGLCSRCGRSGDRCGPDPLGLRAILSATSYANSNLSPPPGSPTGTKPVLALHMLERWGLPIVETLRHHRRAVLITIGATFLGQRRRGTPARCAGQPRLHPARCPPASNRRAALRPRHSHADARARAAHPHLFVSNDTTVVRHCDAHIDGPVTRRCAHSMAVPAKPDPRAGSMRAAHERTRRCDASTRARMCRRNVDSTCESRKDGHTRTATADSKSDIVGLSCCDCNDEAQPDTRLSAACSPAATDAQREAPPDRIAGTTSDHQQPRHGRPHRLAIIPSSLSSRTPLATTRS